MNIILFTKPKALATMLFAFLFIIYPQGFFMLIGTSINSAGEMMTRTLGGAYLATALSLWSIKSNKDISAKNAYLYALGDIIGGLAIAFAITQMGLNIIAMLLCAVYLLFAAAFVGVAKSKAYLKEMRACRYTESALYFLALCHFCIINNWPWHRIKYSVQINHHERQYRGYGK